MTGSQFLSFLKDTSALDVVIDSDTGNETDDQFAIVYALLHPERLRIKGLISAPFLHYRVLSPEEGEFVSFLEQQWILSYFPKRSIPIWRGASAVLAGSKAERCEGAVKLVELSRKYSKERPLLIIGIAGLTDIALALRLDPGLAERAVLLWLGGQLYDRDPGEFNLLQDPEATKEVFDSALPIIAFPCADVAQALTLTAAQAKELVGESGVGEFLLHRFRRQLISGWGENFPPETTLSIWDVAPFAWLVNPEWAVMTECMRQRLETDPVRRGDFTGRVDLVAQKLDRESIFADFASRIGRK